VITDRSNAVSTSGVGKQCILLDMLQRGFEQLGSKKVTASNSVC
jgi:hypothetical protein